MLADAYAFLMQFPSVDTFRGDTKIQALEQMISWSTRGTPDAETLQKVNDAFKLGIGSPGTAFITTLGHQIAYVAIVVLRLQQEPDSNYQGAADWARLNASKMFGFRRGTRPGRHILLHLLDPKHFERIASTGHKEEIVEKFLPQIDWEIDPENDLDQNLARIREYLEEFVFEPHFDFYDEDVKPYWQGDKQLPTIDDLAAATHLETSYLREVESLLNTKKHLIFEGPPGSGKTFVADKFARYFTGQPLDGDPNEQLELVQFHQSYSYEDFMEGIRPETNDDGQLVYNVQKGIFREFAEVAEANRDKKFVLIIDEINRGNLSRILGELMLLLEYRDKSAKLPYSKEQLRIPDNLYIIGTMNSADRSLSQIDYALRRRFYFVPFMSVENGQASALEGWLSTTSIPSPQQQQTVELFVRLNTLLGEKMKTDDLQVGHSYFMRTDIHEEETRKQVWRYAVMPLLREYLYHHRDRDTLLEGFALSVLAPQAVSISETITPVDQSGDA